MTPAFTKPISATVIAPDDWAMAVVRKPVDMPRRGVPVDFSRSRLMVWPVPVFRPSVIMAMPSRIRARPPRLVMRTEIFKAGNTRSFFAVSNPVFEFERRDPFEFSDVVRNQNQAFASGMAGNVKVIHTDGLANFLK